MRHGIGDRTVRGAAPLLPSGHENGGMNEIPIEQHGHQPDETPQEAQRSLAGVLLSDINTVATTVVSAVAGTRCDLLPGDS